jgi:hypothetical protein
LQQLTYIVTYLHRLFFFSFFLSFFYTVWFVASLEAAASESIESNSVYVQLLGNHELMQVVKDFHDVSVFDDQFAHAAQILKQSGVSAREALFSPHTCVGKWIRSKRKIVRVDDPIPSTTEHSLQLWGIDTCQSRYFENYETKKYYAGDKHSDEYKIKMKNLNDAIKKDPRYIANPGNSLWFRTPPKRIEASQRQGEGITGNFGVFSVTCSAPITFNRRLRSELKCPGAGGAVVFTHGGFNRDSLLKQVQAGLHVGRGKAWGKIFSGIVYYFSVTY